LIASLIYENRIKIIFIDIFNLKIVWIFPFGLELILAVKDNGFQVFGIANGDVSSKKRNQREKKIECSPNKKLNY
jgi:hypothetical protein